MEEDISGGFWPLNPLCVHRSYLLYGFFVIGLFGLFDLQNNMLIFKLNGKKVGATEIELHLIYPVTVLRLSK